MLAVSGRPFTPSWVTNSPKPVSSTLAGGGGGSGTPLCKSYKYVPLQRVWFLGLFGLKTGTHFAHFGLESGMVFERTTGAYERSYRFNFK